MRLLTKAYLILIHVGVEQLLVAAVDDSRTITGSKDMVHPITLEGLKGDGLAAQAQLLSLTQLTCKSAFEHEQGQEACMATQLRHADCMQGFALHVQAFCQARFHCA